MKKEHIIIGGGIAGCTLAWRLSQEGHNVLLFDDDDSASSLAGGVINPLIGRNFNLKWNLKEHYQSLENFYKSLDPYSQQNLFYERPLFRSISDKLLFQKIIQKISDDIDFSHHVLQICEHPPSSEFLSSQGILIRAYWINIQKVLSLIKNLLKRKGQYKKRTVNWQDIDLSQKKVRIQGGESSQYLTLCQGWKGSYEYPFSHLPFKAVKGERLIVEFETSLSNPKIMYKKNDLLIPLDNKKAYIGGTYEWNNLNTVPTQKKREQLEETLNHMINIPFKVLDHSAHVRPATKDRRPFLGNHPRFSQLYIFNGLGSLGLSLAPAMSDHLISLWQKSIPLPKEVNINRFD